MDVIQRWVDCQSVEVCIFLFLFFFVGSAPLELNSYLSFYVSLFFTAQYVDFFLFRLFGLFFKFFCMFPSTINPHPRRRRASPLAVAAEARMPFFPSVSLESFSFHLRIYRKCCRISTTLCRAL